MITIEEHEFSNKCRKSKKSYGRLAACQSRAQDKPSASSVGLCRQKTSLTGQRLLYQEQKTRTEKAGRKENTVNPQ